MTAETLGQALRRLRSARGLSLADLGALVNYSRKTIHDWERGRRRPLPAAVAALDRVLAADGYLAHLAATAVLEALDTYMPLAAHTWQRRDAEALADALVSEQPTPHSALSLAHEWLVTDPPQRFELRAGRHIGDGLVDQIEARVHQIRRLDDHIGGLDTYAVAATELRSTAVLLRDAAYGEQTGRRLLAAISELCQIAGWVTSDAGRYGEAQRLYLAGARAAHAAGDQPGAASNLSSLAYQMANVGDPREAVLLARSAAKGATGHASATTLALLLERVAWAHARAGEPDAAARVLDQVDEAFDGREPGADPTWVYWLSREEIEVMQGRVWTQLRRPLRAVPVLEHALARYPQDASREVALYLTWLAESLVLGREVDRAAELATRALRLSREAHSVRAAARVDALRGMLEPFASSGGVAVFLDEAAMGALPQPPSDASGRSFSSFSV